MNSVKPPQDVECAPHSLAREEAASPFVEAQKKDIFMTDHRIGLTEGLLIAGVPAAGYWLAFLYEFGYCKYFDIPAEFVEIGVLNVLIAIVGLAGFLAVINLYGGLLYALSGILHRAIRVALFRIAIVFCAIAGLAMVTRMTQPQFIGLSVIFVGLHAFGQFVFPLITQRKIKGYVNKLEAQNRLDFERETVMDVFAKSIGDKAFVLFILLLSLSFAAFVGGAYQAKRQADFMVVENAQDKIIIKRHGEDFLIAQFDREAKSISSRFNLMSGENEFGFRYERIGPLVPVGLENQK